MDGNPGVEPQSQGLDPRFYLRVLNRRKWLILLVFAAVVGGTALYTMRQPKVFGAQISVIIDITAPRFLDRDVQDVNTDSYSNYWANKEYYETQHKVILSRAVAQRVVEKLGLQSDAAFLGLEKIADPKARAEAMKKADAPAILQGKIKVEPIKDSRVTLIKVEESEPNRAALLSNEVAEAYIQENLSLKLRVTETAMTWLEERRENLEETAKKSDFALYDFKRQQDMLSTGLEDRQSIVSQRLVAVNTALTETKLKIAGLKARVAAIRGVQEKADRADPMWADALATTERSTVSEYKKRFVDQRLECAEMRDRYLEGHPKLSSCLEKLKVVEADFKRELTNIVVAAEADLREAQEKEKNLNVMLDQSKADAFEVNKKQIDFDRIKREADQNQRLYDSVLKRLKDIELSGLLRTSNVRVLDSARPSLAPVRPNVLNNVLFSMLFGLLLGIGLALALEFLDTTVKNQGDVEEKLGLAFLGLVPSLPVGDPAQAQAKELHMHREPRSLIAECMRAIRTNLLFMSPDKPFRTMVVTSAAPQEGKSTTVINLGVAMAQSGNRVLVIDTDMRRPRLHKAFGVSNEVGVSSLVVGEGDMDAAVKSTEVPNLFVLPCGPVPPNPAELLHTQAFHELLAKLGTKFDRVILDSPPVGAVADAAVLAAQVDGVLLVLKADKTNKDAAKRMVRTLRDVKARIFGAVLNDVNLERSKYGDYYYGYSYKYYGYGKEQKKEA